MLARLKCKTDKYVNDDGVLKVFFLGLFKLQNSEKYILVSFFLISKISMERDRIKNLLENNQYSLILMTRN